ncbi:MAG: 50S ribosomal protein L9 [Aquiluna sp.]|jgi:large subunit ribosomal protein L9|nr:50S ribosomal protein L9 [Aquiluna sp.]
MSKLILTNEVQGLGSAGDIVEVKNGYARNFLIPTGLAVVWSRGGEKQVTQIRDARDARAIASEEEALEIKSKLEGALITITSKAGTNGRLFGAIKTSDLAEAIQALGFGEVDKRKIQFASSIRTVGNYEASVRLNSDLVARVKIQVVAAN